MRTTQRKTVVGKGWGMEELFVNESYCGKRLTFSAGKKNSFHYHREKDETFLVIRGTVRLDWSENDARENCDVLQVGDVFHCPPGLRHRITALSDAEIIEFSTHHDDADVVRIEKGD